MGVQRHAAIARIAVTHRPQRTAWASVMLGFTYTAHRSSVKTVDAEFSPLLNVLMIEPATAAIMSPSAPAGSISLSSIG